MTTPTLFLRRVAIVNTIVQLSCAHNKQSETTRFNTSTSAPSCDILVLSLNALLPFIHLLQALPTLLLKGQCTLLVLCCGLC